MKGVKIGRYAIHVRTRARADVPRFPHLGNGWTDCADICCVVRGPLAVHFTQDGDIFSSARVTVPTHI